MLVRSYNRRDKPLLLQMLHLNSPKYFHPAEAAEFAEYLDKYIEDYFVIEEAGRIIGCGGINYEPKKRLAYISWDIIHPEYQGNGYGKRLLLYRLDIIKKQAKYRRIIVRTSQKTDGFYKKFGFQLLKTEPDYWAPGLDLYEMHLDV